MLTIACCFVVGFRVRIRFSVWLVSGYAHVFILLSIVIVPYPFSTPAVGYRCGNSSSQPKHLQLCN